MITEIVVLGRGGQGGVTGAQILAKAAYISNKYKDVASCPTFGTERRGSPVYAFTRIADEKIWTRQNIYNPDIAIVMDETILTDAFIKSIKPNGRLVLNTDKCVSEVVEYYKLPDDMTVATANVTHSCIENGLIVDGQPMVNTPILGVAARIFKNITLKNISDAIKDHLGEKKAKINIKVAEICSEITEIRNGGN